MGFINRYIKSDLNNYNYSEEFNEVSDSYIYSVGKTEGMGLISKFDNSGKIVWEKTYQDSNGGTFELKEIIQLKFTNGNGVYPSYIAYGVLDDMYCLLCIDSVSGTLLWSKQLDYRLSQTKLLIKPSKASSDFFLIISQYASDPGSASKIVNPKLLKFDASGNVLINNGIDHSAGMYINILEVSNDGFFVACNFNKDNTGLQFDSILKFDNELSFIWAKYLDNANLTIHDLKIINDSDEYEILISGCEQKSNHLFVAKIDTTTSGAIYYVSGNYYNDSRLLLANEHFYLLDYNDFGGVLHKIDYAFKPQWSKTMLSDKKDVNGLKFVKELSNKLTFTLYDNDDGSLVASSNLEFDSCKTIILPDLNFFSEKINSTAIGFEQTDIEFSIYDNFFHENSIISIILNCCPDDTSEILLTENVSLQSSNFILTAAGSTGNDGSAIGVHLRWIFGGKLGENHLPKGNYYINQNFGFNKPNDFVKVYKAPYIKTSQNLNFSLPPTVVNNVQRFWIYNLDGKQIYVYFRNSNRYDTVRQTINPMTEPLLFMKNYGKELVEVESKRDLFFAANVYFGDSNNNSSVKIESLSVKDNLLTAPKITSSRKKYVSYDVENILVSCENGRSVRFASIGCHVVAIEFEFYSNFIEGSNKLSSWSLVGKYSLSLDDAVVLNRLEPEPGLIHGQWLRFNEHETTNIENYTDRWNGPVNDLDRNIKFVTQRYLELSTDIGTINPTGIESFNFDLDQEDNLDGSPAEPSPDDITTIPLLDILKFGANDFHVARILGLGTLDLDSKLLDNNQFIYITEYITYGDLEDGYGTREVKHLSMSLPTGMNDERLPIPINLSSIEPGIILDNDEEATESITDENGYNADGTYRYVSLRMEDLPVLEVNKIFYYHNNEFNISEISFPIYAGLHYKMSTDPEWLKPELENDPTYKNIFNGGTGSNETIPLVLPEENNILHIHKQNKSGIHKYGSYGINIFFRATTSANILPIETLLLPKNKLKPPLNLNPYLIRDEEPLMFTSESEQVRKSLLDNHNDKTLVRLTFDYHSTQELVRYQIEETYSTIPDSNLENIIVGGYPNEIYTDDKELYANEVEIFFRDEVPNVVTGKIISLVNHPGNELLLIATTSDYLQASTAVNGQPTVLHPEIPLDKADNFVGGILINGDRQYVVHQIDVTGYYPIFTVFKSEVSESMLTIDPDTEEEEELIFPEISGDGLFHIVENMQNVVSWNNPLNSNVTSSSPSTFTILLGHSNTSVWKFKREVIHLIDDYNEEQRILEKSKGIWEQGFIEEVEEPISSTEQPDGSVLYENAFNGLYKIRFDGFELPQHEQFSTDGNSVEWFRGIVRLRTEDSFAVNGERQNLEVLRIANIGTGDLELYVVDSSYPGYDADPEILAAYERVKLGFQNINYNPGYKVYLTTDAAINLKESATLPTIGSGGKTSIFGLRSHNSEYNYYSKLTFPALMYAQEIAEPRKPQTPLGAKYATRPDFFGKSTYSFTTLFGENGNSNYYPHGLLFLRSNEEAILNSLYSDTKLEEIKSSLEVFGGNDEVWLKDRWNNFLNFDNLRVTGAYSKFPPENTDGFIFPLPDSDSLMAEINNFIIWHNQHNGGYPDVQLPLNEITSLNQIIIPSSSGISGNLLFIDFVEQAIKNTFVPLTEFPIIYQYIKPLAGNTTDYQPTNRKQNIRDKNGYMLDPNHADFEMAPMAKKLSDGTNAVSFTDFTLDGISKNIYFYSVKEMSNQMQMGEFSDFLGPIKLVNTNSPDTPEIKRIMPVLENRILNIEPHVQFEINAYTKFQHIKKINLYRSNTIQNAQSIRSMHLVKTIDIETEGLEGMDIWTFTDDFSDLLQIPYGDPLFYRITVSRKVEYDEAGSVVIEYAPSTASKISATSIVENYNPETPILSYTADTYNDEADEELNDITLSWESSLYKGNYTLFKMNPQGNWIEIVRLIADLNDEGVYHFYNQNELGEWVDYIHPENLAVLDTTIYLPLEKTNLATSSLVTKKADGKTIYHHFKVVAENTAGMISNKDLILTLYQSNTYQSNGGISDPLNPEGMIIEGNFIIKNNL